MQHTTQSVRYMLSAKEDIIRKHVKGMDVMQDLARVCPSLTLQQVQRLTQCHHDDWVGHDSGPSGAGLDLLRALQHRADQEPLGQTIQQVTSPAKVLSAKQQQVLPLPSPDVVSPQCSTRSTAELTRDARPHRFPSRATMGTLCCWTSVPPCASHPPCCEPRQRCTPNPPFPG
jgi:hypothetical protein